jgi:dipeptidyl aminopeptidase/acylaminoacyl peptidase
LQHESREQLLGAARKLPILMFHGTSDNTIPIATGRESRDALIQSGFPVEFHDLMGFEHNTLYTRGSVIAPQVWEFLKGRALAEDPRYQVYSYAK